MKDVLLLAALVVSFALLATVHVTLVVGLARRPPRWRALAAVLLAPLAPYWGYRERLRIRTWLWILAAAAYALARFEAR